MRTAAAIAVVLPFACAAPETMLPDSGSAQLDGGIACRLLDAPGDGESEFTCFDGEDRAETGRRWLAAAGLDPPPQVERGDDGTWIVHADMPALTRTALRRARRVLQRTEVSRTVEASGDCRLVSRDPCTAEPVYSGECDSVSLEADTLLERFDGVFALPRLSTGLQLAIPFRSRPAGSRPMPPICRDSSWVRTPPTAAPELLGTVRTTYLGFSVDACFWVDLAGSRSLPDGDTAWGYRLLASAGPDAAPVSAPCGGGAAIVPSIAFSPVSACDLDNLADRDETRTACGFDGDMKDRLDATFCAETIPRTWGGVAARIGRELGEPDCDGRDALGRTAAFAARALAAALQAAGALDGPGEPVWTGTEAGDDATLVLGFRTPAQHP